MKGKMQMSGGFAFSLPPLGVPPSNSDWRGCEVKGREKPWVESWRIWTLVLTKWETVGEPLILFGLNLFVKYWRWVV